MAKVSGSVARPTTYLHDSRGVISDYLSLITESMTRIITRLQGMSLPGVNVNLKQCYEALGDLEKMQKQLAGIREDVESLDKFFNKKREELE